MGNGRLLSPSSGVGEQTEPSRKRFPLGAHLGSAGLSNARPAPQLLLQKGVSKQNRVCVKGSMGRDWSEDPVSCSKANLSGLVLGGGGGRGHIFADQIDSSCLS